MDSDNINQGEVNSPMQSSQPKNETLINQSIGRQSSIYSLTLDEFQNTLNESRKNFGSMNMDEFLNTIWTAEEIQNQAQEQAQAQALGSSSQTGTTYAAQYPQRTDNATSDEPSSLPRQGSVTVPEPLCRKTVDEVWSEIHRSEQRNNNQSRNDPNPNTTTQRQVTFGEMTLEDFLVRAGIVREHNFTSGPPPYNGMQQNISVNIPAPGPTNYMARPILAVVGGAGANVASYQTGGVYPHQPLGVGYGGRMGNGSGGFGQVQGLAIGSPSSPVSSGGLCVNQMDGMDMSVTGGGRKRVVDGPVEKVVERRQRRMIKNRESAARSRARKQAYTVELEAELNQLKEENAHLKQALDEYEKERRQQKYEESRAEARIQFKSQKVDGKVRASRRSSSCHY